MEHLTRTKHDGRAYAIVQLRHDPGNAAVALKLLARVVLDVIVEARRRDGVHE